MPPEQLSTTKLSVPRWFSSPGKGVPFKNRSISAHPLYELEPRSFGIVSTASSARRALMPARSSFLRASMYFCAVFMASEGKVCKGSACALFCTLTSTSDVEVCNCSDSVPFATRCLASAFSLASEFEVFNCSTSTCFCAISLASDVEVCTSDILHNARRRTPSKMHIAIERPRQSLRNFLRKPETIASTASASSMVVGLAVATTQSPLF
mmetsp:Transcript_41399/g.88223  ORF Transcript_41399/g.88223 Transcript_41399/m.88223 type:complete len:210 (+) Transcript_41399:228-857(+)